MFRKKKGEDDGAIRPGAEEGREAASAPPLKPFSRRGSHAPTKPLGTTPRHDIPRRPPEPPSAPRRFERGRSAESKKLTVGRDICLSGEITSCHRLIVEGRVEVALDGAHAIEVTQSGYFKGKAEVNEADISGLFEGELIAREILTVRTGGRINGKVRYGRIVIEAGGEISGDMRAADKPAPKPVAPEPAPKPEPEVPAAAGDSEADGSSSTGS